MASQDLHLDILKPSPAFLPVHHAASLTEHIVLWMDFTIFDRHS